MNLAVIPARKGSKGLKDKNIFPLAYKPLILHTIEATIKSGIFDRILVTTDSLRITLLCKKPVRVYLRPDNLCEDNTPLAPVVIEALSQMEKGNKIYDTITTLQPTSPLRTAQHIVEAMERFNSTKADSLLSVTEELHSIWSQGKSYAEPLVYSKTNRQYTTPHYVANGAIFITKRNILLDSKDRIGGKVTLYPMSKKASIDIHNIEDIRLAEWYMKQKN